MLSNILALDDARASQVGAKYGVRCIVVTYIALRDDEERKKNKRRYTQDVSFVKKFRHVRSRFLRENTVSAEKKRISPARCCVPRDFTLSVADSFKFFSLSMADERDGEKCATAAHSTTSAAKTGEYKENFLNDSLCAIMDDLIWIAKILNNSEMM